MDQLRKLHNNCKRKLILDWVKPGQHILDCGCGRGGDIHKWNLIKNLKVTAIDPDEESLKEAISRSTESGYGIWFLPPGDITNTLAWGPYDVVCYNFALHYIFENMETYTKSVWAISQAVKPGGYLIGITPDNTRLQSILNSSSKFVDRLGNSLEVKGEKLMVHLMDGPYYAQGAKEEPLLNKDLFISSMSTYGFKMVVWEPMLKTPNGLVSDIYSQFVFVKQ
jgi:SAM-dependent methyltransferase